MTATDGVVGPGAGRPGELLDHVVGALAGFGALDVAVLRDERGHRVAEIVVDGNGDGDCRILLAADATGYSAMSGPSARHAVDVNPTEALIAERERVARDLHDGVVQDVFATAMTLAALVPLLPADVGRRLEELIDKQDEIVRRLRTTVFALKGCGAGGRPARDAVQRVALEASRALGFEPSVTFEGAVECLDGTELLDHLVMAFREALSNIARHAQASRVDARLSLTPSTVAFVVADNGRGPGAHQIERPVDGAPSIVAGDGLHNLDQRARLFGGRCVARAGGDGGTVVEWETPRPAAWSLPPIAAAPTDVQDPARPSSPAPVLGTSAMPSSARTSSSET